MMSAGTKGDPEKSFHFHLRKLKGIKENCLLRSLAFPLAVISDIRTSRDVTHVNG